MLDQKDLEQIGKVFDSKLAMTEDRIGKVFDDKLKVSEGRIIVAVGEMLEQQVLPQITTLDERVERLEGTVANLPDKAYLDNKFADFNGDCVRRDKRVNQKVDSAIGLLQQKDVFTKDEVSRIQHEYQTAQ